MPSDLPPNDINPHLTTSTALLPVWALASLAQLRDSFNVLPEKPKGREGKDGKEGCVLPASGFQRWHARVKNAVICLPCQTKQNKHLNFWYPFGISFALASATKVRLGAFYPGLATHLPPGGMLSGSSEGRSVDIPASFWLRSSSSSC